MKIAANYALGVAYYKYKTLISFKIYVVLYQYQSTQFKKYKLLNDNSSESVIVKSVANTLEDKISKENPVYCFFQRQNIN